MTTPPTSDSSSNSDDKAGKEAELLKKVSERVWQLLQQDLRRDQERRGKRFGS